MNPEPVPKKRDARSKAKQSRNVDAAVKQADIDKQNKRTKERTILDIIKKVATWRKLYLGVISPNDIPGVEAKPQ